jgi:hypothetical protein
LRLSYNVNNNNNNNNDNNNINLNQSIQRSIPDKHHQPFDRLARGTWSARAS